MSETGAEGKPLFSHEKVINSYTNSACHIRKLSSCWDFLELTFNLVLLQTFTYKAYLHSHFSPWCRSNVRYYYITFPAGKKKRPSR